MTAQELQTVAKVRKRFCKTTAGEEKAARVVDYSDQAGKRHLKTFATKKAADTWLVTTRHAVAHGTHTPETASITVAEAAELWIRRGELEQLERSTLTKYRNHVDMHIKPLLGAV